MLVLFVHDQAASGIQQWSTGTRYLQDTNVKDGYNFSFEFLKCGNTAIPNKHAMSF